MPRKLLSDAFVRSVKVAKAETESKRDPNKTIVKTQTSYFEKLDRGVSLALIVGYGGTKAFAVVTYRAGKPVWRRLGAYPAMSLQKAREAARAYHRDPKQFEQQANVGSFREVAEQWFRRHVVLGGLRSQDEIKRHLERYVFPFWKDAKFLDIRRGEVNDLLDHIQDHHGPAQADAVLSTLRSIMNWHQSRNEHYTSPIVRGMQRCKNKPRDRILNDDELRAIWNVAGESGQFGAFVRMCLLSAQRQNKVTGMRWNDVVDGVWIIPQERREKGTGERLKLSDAALAVLAGLPRINEYVFPALRGRGPFATHAQNKHEFDKKLPDMPGWTLHDCRRTARSLMSRAGVRPDVAERVLGHAIRGVEGVYDRYDYFDEKGDALAQLAGLIERIVDPQSNVVPLRAMKGASNEHRKARLKATVHETSARSDFGPELS